MINYHPSVCHQTDTFHMHYNIIMQKEKPLSDLQRLQDLAGRVGGATAGQVVEALLDKIAIGFDITLYGVVRIQKEALPTHQICHKGENDSPSIDWDKWLFIPTPVVEDRPPANARVAHISHK